VSSPSSADLGYLYTNPADSDSGIQKPSTTESDFEFVELPSQFARRPLSSVGGTKLREECTFETRDGADHARTWERVVNEWRLWYHDRKDRHNVYMDVEGELSASPAPNRFSPGMADTYYAKFKSFERFVKESFGRHAHQTMMTFTASNRNTEGGYRCPADHLNEMAEGLKPALREVRRLRSSGMQVEYILIPEPHDSGYAHYHMAVYTDEPVSRADFEPALDAYLRATPTAGESAHVPEDVIDVKQIRENGQEAVSVAGYLSEYVGLYSDSPLTEEIHVQAFDALLWATGRQRFRPSNGAQDAMQPDREPSTTDWTFFGQSPDSDPENAVELGSDRPGVEYVEIDGSAGFDPPRVPD